MESITHKPIFWFLLTAASLACIGLSYNYFSTAFPIVNVALAMNRSEAMQKASDVATQLHIGPAEFHQAASFDVDNDVQTFVELEAGGKEAFTQMIKDPYYAPYQWTVRHFKECDKHEAYFKFKPDGTPYGFIETLSENMPGAALEIAQAQTIAEHTAATTPWNIQLTDYHLVESSKEVRPGGRIDYQFTYERNGIVIGKGFYRLLVVVSGDKVSQISHSVKIPEEFTLRYQEMRSANNSIAAGANIAFLLLYIFGGCILGLFFLLRRNWVLWKQALIWAIIIAVLHVLVEINQLPLSWMSYHTALSMHGFLLRLGMGMISQFLYMAIFYGLIFIAAESLTRAAFSEHPQLWRVWNTGAASSQAIIGRTLASYLMMPLFLAFIISFYIVTSRYLSWWMPLTSLIDPNILATYFPWLSCLVLSLGAGFMEECLFRAIPISCSALIGKRFGNRRLWLVLGFIIQALIFGAAHANYPAQPAYARVVELLFFSIINGLVFLWFGLLPAIITHFTYDVVLMSLPLFVSSAAGAWLNQAIVIILTLIPLAIVLRARIKTGAWISLNSDFLNRSWKPLEKKQPHTAEPEIQETKTISKRTQITIWGAGICGLILLITTMRLHQDGIDLNINKTQALEHAHKFLQSKNINPNDWTALATIAADEKESEEQQLQNQFIWQEGGQALYQQILGKYLNPARWYIRFVTWDGSVNERAEEYIVTILSDGKLYRSYHKLPENAPGASLDENQARTIAHQGLQSLFNLDAQQLKEISAEATKHPERKDWTFTFENPTMMPIKQGQLRNVIVIAGDAIAGGYTYVHVPEEWERTQLNRNNILRITSFLCLLVLLFMLGLGMFYAIVHNRRMQIVTRSTLFLCLSLILLGIFKLANSMPAIIATFNTSEPFTHQLFSYLGLSSIGILFRASALGIIIAILTAWKKPHRLTNNKPLIYGISVGLFAVGIASLLQTFNRTYEPLWADFSSLATYAPMLSTAIDAIMVFISLAALFMAVSIIFDAVSLYWRNRRWLFALISLILGIALAGRLQPETISLWLVTSAFITLLIMGIYLTLGRYSHRALLWACATLTGFYYLQQAIFNATPQAIAANILAVLAVFCLAYAWGQRMEE